MRVIICGPRPPKEMRTSAKKMRDWELFHVRDVQSAAIASGLDITDVIQGGARGIDKSAKQWADSTGRRCHAVYANWDRYGKAAGHFRNVDMAENYGAEAVIAITYHVRTAGTADMISVAEARRLPVHIFYLDKIPDLV